MKNQIEKYLMMNEIKYNFFFINFYL